MVTQQITVAPWAAHHPNPIIYEVKPEGIVENDPDVEKPGLSYRCPKAKIVAVHQIPADLLVAAQLALLRWKPADAALRERSVASDAPVSISSKPF